MISIKVTILAIVLLGLSCLVACKDNDENETQSSPSAPTSQQPTAQKATQTLDADEGEEGEEGPAVAPAVAAETPVPLQSAGKQFIYNFAGIA